ncbi:hypothetical protein BCR37DRAFT_70438 [Protomyces lactucae-debilis]|uniref:SH3 domain-containing protein n=1 Tax=Protomyces lactucae-debilis TaxID=2754530 RepID=A0A1Y2F9Z8_PROLT|nr:uncharacterized protein BCR37DRAFT_70438 [Protomyces lactucae-debilis]ORY80457.1 hypothetical protein BCR37DRAFT_70438 [Protomyces lactucae-debilis]
METQDESTPPPLPILTSPSRTRLHAESSQRNFTKLAYIPRDFAYAHDDPLFLRSTETAPSDATDREAAQRRADIVAAQRAKPATQPLPENTQKRDVDDSSSGWTDPPPWLAPTSGGTTPTGGHLEEDAQDLGEGEVHGRAIALFDFTPEHENEFALVEGQQVFISSMHGLGWLVAVDPVTSDCGLVPEEYVRFLGDDEVWALQEQEEGEAISTAASDGVAAQDDGWVDEPHHSDDNNETELTEELRNVLTAAEREMASAEFRNMEDDLPS